MWRCGRLSETFLLAGNVPTFMKYNIGIAAAFVGVGEMVGKSMYNAVRVIIAGSNG